MHRLRSIDPVHRAGDGSVVLTRYRDVVEALRDPSFGAGRDVLLQVLRDRLGDGAAFAYVSRRLSNYDPPDHTRLRGLVSRAFTPRRIDALRPYIERTVDKLLSGHEPGDTFDVIAAVAHPLPSLVICELLGVPDADRDAFDRWTAAIAFLVAPSVAPDRLAAGEAAVTEEWACIEQLIERCRRQPGDDLLSALVAIEGDGDARLDIAELVATVIFLFSAGHQTTRDLIGNGMLALLANPNTWRALGEEPHSAPAAVEECLRFDPPVNFVYRRALCDTKIAGHAIGTGETVVPVLVAANRDPARYAQPDSFDPTRPDNRPVTFGGGIHHCLGAALARIEAEIILQRLSSQFPRSTLANTSIEWRQTIIFRGPEAVLIAT
jgi:cytochrome P450